MELMKRRDFLTVTSTAGAAVLAGCAVRCPPVQTGTGPAVQTDSAGPDALAGWEWRDDENSRIEEQGPDFEVVVRGCSDTDVLRLRARTVPARLDLTDVAARMARTMVDAGGVGIAGPQVGLSLRVATLMLDYKTDKPYTVFVRNPVIMERSDETIDGYEGCLSIPGVGGKVRRNSWIKVTYENEEGEKITTEAHEHNAVLWQHEIDHLDGVLYVDRLLGELMSMEEVRRRRQELDELSPEGSIIIPGSERLSIRGRLDRIWPGIHRC